MNRKMRLPAVLLFCSAALLIVDFSILEDDSAGYYIRKISSICLIIAMLFRLKVERDNMKSPK
ncbi:MAG: hypothetical protein COB60_07185 [Flavobacteriaceae bacterium]|nr:MAG: hypothetical protein COB60_07185 [Flavobacteriaceae bacterium]